MQARLKNEEKKKAPEGAFFIRSALRAPSN